MRKIFISSVLVLLASVGGCGDTDSEPVVDAAAVDAQGDASGDIDASPALGAGVVTLAGSALDGDQDGFRDMASFSNPVNAAVASGYIYVADFDNHRVRRITPEGEVSTISVGAAEFGRPFGMAAAPDGALYVQTDFNAYGDWGKGALWVVAPGSDTVELVVNNIGKARGLAVLDDGRVVMSVAAEHVLRIFAPDSGEITPLAGEADQAGYVDGTGASARFNTPCDLVLLGPDRLLVADRGNHRLRQVTLAGEVTTWAGSGQTRVEDGSRLSASFDMPQALAIDDQGTVYVASLNGYVIQEIAGDTVTTIAGTGEPGYSDGEPLEAQFFGLEGLDTSSDGRYLYIADGNRGEPGPYHRVRRLTLE